MHRSLTRQQAEEAGSRLDIEEELHGVFARIKVVANCYKRADHAVEVAEFLGELTAYALLERLADLQATTGIPLPPATVDGMLDDQDVVC